MTKVPKSTFSVGVELPQKGCDPHSFRRQMISFHGLMRIYYDICTQSSLSFPSSILIRVYNKHAPAADCYYLGSMRFETLEKATLFDTTEFHCSWGHADRSGHSQERYSDRWYFENGRPIREIEDRDDWLRIENILYPE